jgi:regulator of sirC expression with transglutaminase-like and TPR domain
LAALGEKALLPRHTTLKPKIDPDRGGPSTSGDSAAATGAIVGAGPQPTAAETKAAARVRFDALERLLEDDSSLVRDGVRREYERAGRSALPALRRASRNPSAVIRGRARTILTERERAPALRRLMRYVVRADFDLERALFLLARYVDPNLDPRPYQRALDALALEVARRGRTKTAEIERALVVADHLGRELEYGGSLGDFHHPDNIHIHRAIERRAGMPLSLCAIYLFVARRAGLRAAILPLPGHVMLRLYGGHESTIVDPYHKGRIRSERDCRKYLDQNGLPFQAEWLRDAPEKVLFERQVTNLLRSAEMRRWNGVVRDLRQILRALGPGGRWKRGAR